MEENNACFMVLENDPTIARAFLFIVNFVEEASFLIAREMVSNRNDIKYWKKMSKVDPFFATLYKYYVNLYRRIWRQFQLAYTDENIDQNLVVIRAHFLDLAQAMETVADISAELKLAMIEIDRLNPVYIEHGRVLFRDDVIEQCLAIARGHLVNSMTRIRSIFKSLPAQSVVSTLSWTKLNLAASSPYFDALLSRWSPDHYHQRRPSLHDISEAFPPAHGLARMSSLQSTMSTKDDDMELHLLLTDIQRMSDTFITCANKTYPLDSVRADHRRPSLFERYWLPNLVLLAGSVYLGRELVLRLHDGSLQQLLISSYQSLSRRLTEHILGPMRNFLKEIFDTIRRQQDGMVTREDLQQSQETLNRMLDDFVKVHKDGAYSGYGYSGLKSQIQTLTGSTSKQAPGEGISSPNAANAGTSSSSTGSTSGSTSGSSGSRGQSMPSPSNNSLTTDAIMEILMRNYESELKTPVTGFLFGNLMTTMLIQMQKLKVHTEAALLTMDQVLASNQLTMAGTAAMPALITFSVCGYWFYRLVVPPPPKPGKQTISIRLAMSDVERSLQDVYGGGRVRDSDSGAGLLCGTCRAPSAQFLAVSDTSSSRGPPLQGSLREHSAITLRPEFNASYQTSEKSSRNTQTQPVSAKQSQKGQVSFSPNVSFSADVVLTDETYFGNLDYTPRALPKPTTVRNMAAEAEASDTQRANAGEGITSYYDTWQSSLPRENESAFRISNMHARGLLRFHMCQLQLQAKKLFVRDQIRWGHHLRELLRWTVGTTGRWAQYLFPHSTLFSNLIASPRITVSAAYQALTAEDEAEATIGPNEYASLCRDLQILLAPDFLACGCKKLATAQRMRVSYQCLIPPAR